MADCPRCAPERSPLENIPARDVQAHGCRRCGGLFLDNLAFKAAVVDPKVRKKIEQALRQGVAERDLAPPVACVVCGEPMQRQRAGQVAIDVCRAHGIWFDRSELDLVVEQMVAAGMDQQYTPAVEAMRQNLRSPPPAPTPTGEPAPKRESGSGWEFLGAILEIVTIIIE
jgi:Zn-finger nucleic acid-binding protein